MCPSSRVIMFRINGKTPSKISMFLLAYGCHIGTPKRNNLGVTFLRSNGKVVLYLFKSFVNSLLID